MNYWVLILGILLSQYAHANPCAAKIQIKKRALSYSEKLYTIPAQNSECFESKNKFHQPIYSRFENKVSTKTNTEPYYLLKIQRAIYAKGLPEALPMFDLILNHDIGIIRDINILEAFLMTEHLSLNGSKGEFGALILKKSNGEMKVYFSSSSEATVYFSKTVFSNLEKDLNSGFTFFGHLHNHPFSFDNPYGDISGTTIPSVADRQVYNDFKIKYGLKNAFVTNGFSTIAIPDSQFESLPHK